MSATQHHTPKTFKNFIEFLPMLLTTTVARILPYKLRNHFFAKTGGFIISKVPSLRKRVLDGLNRVYPDMNDNEKIELCKSIGQQVGRSWSEILFNATYKNQLPLFQAKEPNAGLAILKDAQEKGKGVILFSGHFGQFDAVRHYLKSKGMETGAVYRENNNPWYDPYFLHGLEEAGKPIMGRDASGRMKMVKHLRKGGFLAMLVDQKFQGGDLIPFLGHNALTSTVPAQLALRYDLPLIPAFGIRAKNGFNIDIEFGDPIEHSDAITMTRQMNDCLSAKILEHPDQWYWLHQRWKDIDLYHPEHIDSK